MKQALKIILQTVLGRLSGIEMMTQQHTIKTLDQSSNAVILRAEDVMASLQGLKPLCWKVPWGFPCCGTLRRSQQGALKTWSITSGT